MMITDHPAAYYPDDLGPDADEEGCTCEDMAGLCPVHAPDVCPTCGYRT